MPIVYGLPWPEDLEAAKQGLLILGGDDLSDNMPTWYCGNDDYAWDGPDPARAIREVLARVAATLLQDRVM